MSFSAAGVYTQVSGAVTAAAGQVIQSAVWNNIHTDLGNALTSLGSGLINQPMPRNILSANGCFEIWQRGAGGAASIAVAASTTAYTADRWYIVTGANQAHTVSQQTGLTGTSISGARVQRNAAQTGTGQMVLGYPLDSDEVIRMRGQKVSLRFLAATGADWSPANGTLTCTLYTGTGAVTKAGAGASAFTGATAVVQIAQNLAQSAPSTAYAALSAAIVPGTATQGEVQFTWTPTGTAGANDWFTADNVMVDISAMPAQGFELQFERLPFDFMLGECRRHYWKTFAYGTAPAQGVGAGTGEIMGLAGKAGAAAEALFWRNSRPMRATPGTVTLYNPVAANAQVRDETANADCSASTSAGVTAEGGYITATGNVGTAAGNLLGLHLTVDAGI